MAKTTRTFWAIFAGPKQTGKPGTRYIASDGTVTKQKQLAAKSVTYGDAEKFAQSKDIRLDGITLSSASKGHRDNIKPIFLVKTRF